MWCRFALLSACSGWSWFSCFLLIASQLYPHLQWHYTNFSGSRLGFGAALSSPLSLSSVDQLMPFYYQVIELWQLDFFFTCMIETAFIWIAFQPEEWWFEDFSLKPWKFERRSSPSPAWPKKLIWIDVFFYANAQYSHQHHSALF